MANPYIASSKLTPHEVETMVLGLVCFNTYREIATAIHRSPQALRPALVQIERRMYFEFDGWPIFHMLQLSSYNPNRNQIPYRNEIQDIIECVLRVPRREGRPGMRMPGPKVSFDAELECLYSCPQHLPPNEFVERYGLARPVQSAQRHPLEQECYTRIGLKKSCSSCRSGLRDIWTSDRKYFFRFAMEYAKRFGKPRPQHVDLFIARMAYVLVWRAFDLNAIHFRAFYTLVHKSEAGNLPPEQRQDFVQTITNKDREHVAQTRMNARNAVAKLVLKHLASDPIRVDRRGVHKQKAWPK